MSDAHVAAGRVRSRAAFGTGNDARVWPPASMYSALPTATRSSRCWSDEDWSESPGVDLRHAGVKVQEFPDHNNPCPRHRSAS